MHTVQGRLFSFSLAVLFTAGAAGCVVSDGDEKNTDESPSFGGTGGGSGGGTPGGSGGAGATGSGATGSGATGGTEGGAAGTGSGGSGADGGAAPECIEPEDPDFDGDDDPATRPSCDALPYAAQSCDGTDPTGLYICRSLAITATEGVYQIAHSWLNGIDVEDACSAEHDSAVAAIFAGDENHAGIRASACENPAAADACTRLASMNTSVQLTGCPESLNMLNEEVGLPQVLKCMADSSLDGDPEYGPWQTRFDKKCRIPDVPEAYADNQGATRSCQQVIDVFLPECADARSVVLCQQYDQGWARGGFFDTLVDELGYNPYPDACSAEHAEYAESVLGDLRRAAAPSLAGLDYCEQVHADCAAVSVEECLVHMDILTSTSQLEATACMALAPAETCRDFFLTECVRGD